MTVFQIDINSYGASLKPKDATDEQWAIISKILNLEDKYRTGDYWYSHGKEMVDEHELATLVNMGLDVKIRKVKGLAYDQEFAKLMSSFNYGGTEQRANVTPTILQPIYQVSVSNVGLFDVDEIDYHEDACTDAISALLKEGWRLIAVCPPNDSRRPTYIMGRTRRAREGL